MTISKPKNQSVRMRIKKKKKKRPEQPLKRKSLENVHWQCYHGSKEARKVNLLIEALTANISQMMRD